MLLIKDYLTAKKSMTMTGVVLTFWLVLAVFACRIKGIIADDGPLWAALSFHATYAALHWNKRVRAGKDGLEFSTDGDPNDKR